MIILVTESGDIISNKVVDWFIHLNKPFIRYNCDVDFLENHSLDDMSVISTWFRRDALLEKTCFSENNLPVENKHLQKEYRMLKRHVFKKLKQQSSKVIGNYERYNLNKLDVLSIAKKEGLLVPESLITNKKTELIAFLEKHHRIITKSLSDSIIKSTEKGVEMIYTSEITTDDLNEITDAFFPSFFQKLIPKKYDIRSFYLEGEFYSMAIFSQRNPNTMIDFRNYMNNRTVPYILPENIESKLSNLMHKLELNTGSIDIIHSIDDEFYFLEINPVGQFGQLSADCNYHLDKIIAKTLMNEKN